MPATELAQKYFKTFPAEASAPMWTNPCDDKRHLEILPAKRKDKCNNLPDFIIIGPQKTGTTALMSFLKVCYLFILFNILFFMGKGLFRVIRAFLAFLRVLRFFREKAFCLLFREMGLFGENINVGCL